MAKNDVEIRLVVQDELTKQYKRIQNELIRSNKAVSASQKQLAKDSAASSKKVVSGFGRAKQAAADFKSGIVDAAKRFGPAAVAVALITTAITALGNAMDFVRTKTIEFEKTLSIVKAILQPTTSEFRALNAEARRLGESTAFSASEAGEAFVELGKIGFKTGQIIAATGDVLNIAAAAQIDLARAAELVAGTLKQFGLEADEAQRATDVMANSFTSSALDAERFANAMVFAGPTANDLGISLETTTAAMAVLSGKLITGSMAGTSFRRIMLDMADANGKVAKIIGVAAFKTLDFQGKLEALQAKNLSPTRIKQTFGLLASTSASVLIKGAEQVEKFDEQFQKARGSAKRMADTMLDNVAGATKILESAQEGLALAIGEAFGEAKRKRIEFYTKTISFATSVVSAHKDSLKLVSNVLSDTFLATLNVVVASWRGWIGLLEIGIGSILKTAQAFVTAELQIKKFLNVIGADFDLGRNVRLITELGKEAEIAFERAREAADGFKLSQSINDTKSLNTELEKLGSTVDPLPGLEDIPIEAGKQKKIPGAKTVDFQKALQDSIAAQEKLAEISQQINADLQLELLSGKEKELETLRRFEAEKESILAAGGESAVILDQVISQRRIAILEAEAAKRKALNFQIGQAALSGAGQLSSALGQLSSVNSENAIKEAEARGDSEDQINAIRKEAFQKQKKFSLATALINTAQAVTSGLATVPFVPLGVIAAGTAAVAGAIQIAAINAQKFAGGGFVAGNNFSGDNMLARVNSRELILNPGQQRNILALANGRGGGGGSNITFEAPIINVANGDPGVIRQAVAETYQEFANKFAETQRDTAIHELV